MTGYRQVLARPGVPGPAAGAALASLPIGMLALALLLLVRAGGGSLTAASAVVAVFGAGTCLGILGQGRLLDRHGPRRVLLPAAGVQCLALLGVATAAGAGAPAALLAVLAFTAGLAEPQAGGALRALWPSLVEDEQRPVAAALSSVLFELPVVAGPLVLAAVIRLASVQAAVVVAALASLAGSALVGLSRAAGQWRPPDAAGSGGLFTAMPAVLAVTAVQGLLVGLFQVCCAAAAGTRAAWLYAALSAGSLAGAAGYGVLARRPADDRLRRTAFLLLAAALAVGALCTRTPLLLIPVAVLAGLAIGAISVRCFVDAERLAPPGALAAAATTLTATGLAATSAGTALAGRLVDATRPSTALLVGAGCALLVAVSAGARPASSRYETGRPLDTL